jgi:hypothetical protein
MAGAMAPPAMAQIDVATNELTLQPNVPVLIRRRVIDGIVGNSSHIILGTAPHGMCALARDFATRPRTEVSTPKVPWGIAAIKFAGFGAGA